MIDSKLKFVHGTCDVAGCIHTEGVSDSLLFRLDIFQVFLFISQIINYSGSSYPTRASYSGQVDGFRNPMKNELKTRPCLNTRV